MSLANIDRRLIAALQAIREGKWSYIHGTSPEFDVLTTLAQDLGYPSSWGDPNKLPAYGGSSSAVQWAALGVKGRDSIGGIPCEVVHGTITGGSCFKNVTLRGMYALLEAAALYLPVRTVLETG